MDEPQAARVQAQSFCLDLKVLAERIFCLAQQRMADTAEMNSDLVGAPGQGPYFYDIKIFLFFNNFILRSSILLDIFIQ